MTTWTEDELDRIGRANELQIATERKDGSVPPSIPIWAVRVGDDIVVRSARGAAGAWYRRAVGLGRGHIASGGVDRDVVFADGGRLDRAAIDAAYREKFGVNIYSDGVTTDASAAATLVVAPA